MEEPRLLAKTRQIEESPVPIIATTDLLDVRFFFLATPSILGGGYFSRAKARRLRPQRQQEQSWGDDGVSGRPIPQLFCALLVKVGEFR